MRWMTTGGGTLPLRKPGHAQVAPELARGRAATRRSHLGGRDLGLDAHARLGQLGDGRLDVGGHARRTIASGHGPQRLPPATRAAAWLVTGPLGHLAGGVVDWATFLAGYARGRVRTSMA